MFCVVFRYQRGNRSLAANLSTSQSSSSAASPKVETQEQEDDYDIPEELESVIGQLQVHFAFSKNLSRSAAKNYHFCRPSAGWIKG